MKPDTVNKLNGLGMLWRFVMPFLLLLFGFVLNGIRADIADLRSGRNFYSARMLEYTNEMRSYFTNHLQEHKQIELGLEKRLATLETNQREVLRILRSGRGNR